MNARSILGILGTLILMITVLLSGAVIWVATAEPEVLASAQVSRGWPGLVQAVVSRAISLIW
ncbi:MAG: hypothetical protein M3R55_12195 [Acidobacteriota bacterium]|nr:hypothetical protein [Acidobacteriota bacterium]